MPSVKLIYFPIRGLGEIPRILLSYGNIEFEDVRVGFDKWTELKPTTPFGQLPVLEWDGVQYAQANAISRFIARKAGLYSDCAIEALQIDSVIELTRDLQTEYGKMFAAEDKNAFFAKLVAETLPKFLANAEKFLKEHGGEYFVGNKLTWADIAVAEYVNDFTNANEPRLAAMGIKEDSRLTILKDFPLLQAHLARVQVVPAIKKWHETRQSDADEAEMFKTLFAARAAMMAAQEKK